jgi:hypothetical protein
MFLTVFQMKTIESKAIDIDLRNFQTWSHRAGVIDPPASAD